MKNLLLLFLLIFAVGCGSQPTKTTDSKLEITYKPRYASRFEIARSGDSTIIITHNPWQGAKNVDRRFAFTEPQQRIICLSSSHTALLEAVDAADNVIAVSAREFLHSPVMRAKEDIGSDGSFSYEKIVALKPDVMAIYELAGENSSTFKKLTQMGINQIYIADYLENHPLAKAEWIVAFGALVGRQKEAVEIFSSIESRYNELKAKLDSVEDRPKVMLNSPYKDTWYLPGKDNYMVRLVEDAGGQYIADYIEGSDTRPVSFESSYKLLLDTDLWLNPSFDVEHKSDLWEQNGNLKKISAPIYSNIARRTQTGGSDFWESGVVRPDIVLSDLIKIMHPELLPDHTLYYYRPIE